MNPTGSKIILQQAVRGGQSCIKRGQINTLNYTNLQNTEHQHT